MDKLIRDLQSAIAYLEKDAEGLNRIYAPKALANIRGQIEGLKLALDIIEANNDRD